MASIRQLASQTVLYGFTTIFARLLNFALTPLHTDRIAKDDYGILNNAYSLIALLMVLLTFGMETAFFRFYNKEGQDKGAVFRTAVFFTLCTSATVMLLFGAFRDEITHFLRYEEHPQFLWWLLIIVAADAIAAVPLARLRALNKPLRFLVVRLSTIGLMVILNLVFFLVLPHWLEPDSQDWWAEWYRETNKVAFVLIANLIGNGLLLLFFVPDFIRQGLLPSKKLLKAMLWYSAPLVIGFFAGVINEKAQYQFMKFLLPEKQGDVAQGIFGAMMKIATFMLLFIQAFRFAAEPFFFARDGDFKDKIAQVLRYFVIVQSLIFVGLVCFTEILQWTHFIDEKYWEGWHIVPVLLLANLFLGINFNLGLWYKIENRTRMGIYIALWGLVFTVAGNLLLVPRYGYTGAAVATLVSYASMTGFAYYLNQKHHPAPYPVKAILSHLFVAVLIAAYIFYFQAADIFWGLAGFTSFLIYLALSERKSIHLIIDSYARDKSR